MRSRTDAPIRSARLACVSGGAPLNANVIRSMHMAEVIYPGRWLDLPGRDLAFELEGMLRNLEDRVAEAGSL